MPLRGPTRSEYPRENLESFLPPLRRSRLGEGIFLSTDLAMDIPRGILGAKDAIGQPYSMESIAG